MGSNDPEFRTKAAGIIGLYMNPQHAAVFSVDEKTAIHALDRHRFEYAETTRWLR